MSPILKNVIDWNLKKIKDPRTSDRDRERYRKNVATLEAESEQAVGA